MIIFIIYGKIIFQNKLLNDAIYTSNWLDYNVKERKNMWFIMLSSQYDLGISFHGQCGLKLGTFLWVCKLISINFSQLYTMQSKL